jgi:hypothetical protein
MKPIPIIGSIEGARVELDMDAYHKIPPRSAAAGMSTSGSGPTWRPSIAHGWRR